MKNILKWPLKIVLGAFLFSLLLFTQILVVFFSIKKSSKILNLLLQIIPLLPPLKTQRFLSSKWTSSFSCLTKALLVREIYQKNNIYSELKFGVFSGGHEFAHAWIITPHHPQLDFQILNSKQPIFNLC